MTLLLAFFATAWLARSWTMGFGAVMLVGGSDAWLGTTAVWASVIVVVSAALLHRMEHAR